ARRVEEGGQVVVKGRLEVAVALRGAHLERLLHQGQRLLAPGRQSDVVERGDAGTRLRQRLRELEALFEVAPGLVDLPAAAGQDAEDVVRLRQRVRIVRRL